MTTVMITNSVEEAILLSDRIVPIAARAAAPRSARRSPVDAAAAATARAQLAHDEQARPRRARHVVDAPLDRRRDAPDVAGDCDRAARRPALDRRC